MSSSFGSPAPLLIYTGNVIVDIVMTIDGLPAHGGDTLASSSLITAGGGYNVMVAAERDGLPVTFAGQYGSGPFGSIVRSALADSDFDIAQQGLEGTDSGYCIALVDSSAERTFVTHVGAEGQLTRSDLDRVDVKGENVVYVSGYSLAHPVNAAALPGWLDSLPNAVRVITDPSPLIAELDAGTLARVLARTDVFTANAREATLGSGLDNLTTPRLGTSNTSGRADWWSYGTPTGDAGLPAPTLVQSRCWFPPSLSGRSTPTAPAMPTAESSPPPWHTVKRPCMLHCAPMQPRPSR